MPADKLEAVKKRERYGFTLRLDNSESVAGTVAAVTWRCKRTPETIDTAVRAIRAADAGGHSRRWRASTSIENGRTIVTLTGAGRCEMKIGCASASCRMCCLAAMRFAQMRTVTLPGKSPLVTLPHRVHDRRGAGSRRISRAWPT